MRLIIHRAKYIFVAHWFIILFLLLFFFFSFLFFSYSCRPPRIYYIRVFFFVLFVKCAGLSSFNLFFCSCSFFLLIWLNSARERWIPTEIYLSELKYLMYDHDTTISRNFRWLQQPIRSIWIHSFEQTFFVGVNLIYAPSNASKHSNDDYFIKLINAQIECD